MQCVLEAGVGSQPGNNSLRRSDPAGKLHKLGGVLVTSMQQQSGFYMFVGALHVGAWSWPRVQAKR